MDQEITERLDQAILLLSEIDSKLSQLDPFKAGTVGSLLMDQLRAINKRLEQFEQKLWRTN